MRLLYGMYIFLNFLFSLMSTIKKHNRNVLYTVNYTSCTSDLRINTRENKDAIRHNARSRDKISQKT